MVVQKKVVGAVGVVRGGLCFQKPLDVADGKRALEQANRNQIGDVVARVALALRRGNHMLLDVVVHHGGREQLLVGRDQRTQVLFNVGEELVHVEVDRRKLGVARQVQRADEFHEFVFSHGRNLFMFLRHGS